MPVRTDPAPGPRKVPKVMNAASAWKEPGFGAKGAAEISAQPEGWFAASVLCSVIASSQHGGKRASWCWLDCFLSLWLCCPPPRHRVPLHRDHPATVNAPDAALGAGARPGSAAWVGPQWGFRRGAAGTSLREGPLACGGQFHLGSIVSQWVLSPPGPYCQEKAVGSQTGPPPFSCILER